MINKQTGGGVRRKLGMMGKIASFLAAMASVGGAGTDASLTPYPAGFRPHAGNTALSGPFGIPPIPRRVPNQRQRRKMIAGNPRLVKRYRKGGRK